MMRSLNSAVAGLKTHQTKMDVIGNNIANVNTAGFKSSRVVFRDIFYQTTAGASAAGEGGTGGGTNPTQIGYGSQVANIDVLNTQTGATSTGWGFDVYISGDGFLVTRNSNNEYLYTRLGALYFDAEGYIVDGNGNYVLGVQELSQAMGVNTDGTVSSAEPLQIGGKPGDREDLFSVLTNLSVGPDGEVSGLIPGDKVFKSDLTAIQSWMTVVEGTDDNYKGDVTLKSVSSIVDPTGNDDLPSWLRSITTMGYDGAYVQGNITFRLDQDDGKITLTHNGVTYTGYYSPGKDVELIEANPVDPDSPRVFGKVRCDNAQASTLTAGQEGVNADSTGGNTHPTAMAVYAEVVAYYESGEQVQIDPVRIDRTPGAPGNPIPPTTITGGGAIITLDLDTLLNTVMTDDTHSDYKASSKFAKGIQNLTVSQWDADTSTVYQVGYLVLARFPNTQGLQQAGNSYYAVSSNSGDPIMTIPGLNGTGETTAGMLEMSNVDISQEFTDMITTQRGFQANSRIITVSDEMLAELVNLKR